jgi:hypothetical protein
MRIVREHDRECECLFKTCFVSLRKLAFGLPEVRFFRKLGGELLFAVKMVMLIGDHVRPSTLERHND